MENEIWKDITGYEGFYQVSNLGRVRSVARKIIRSNGRVQTFGSEIISPRSVLGYKAVNLCRVGSGKNHYVHRLVASAFVPNPNGYKEINHKNEDKSDNRAENLEWCTRQYNLLYGRRGDSSGKSLGREVVLVSDTGEKMEFDRLTKAAEYLGVTIQAVSQARKKKQKTKGFRVYYGKDFE